MLSHCFSNLSTFLFSVRVSDKTYTPYFCRAATHPKNDLYQGIENAVYIYMSCQKFSKGAETCPNFKNNDLAYHKSIENVGYISCQKRYKDQKLFKNSNTMT